jgi:NAD(P)-dependent dehydrogenase (short-subunit alcohol dehydrogenase family)
MSTSGELAGKVAVITGGANGIGRGIAEVLAGRGAAILIADTDDAASAKLASALRSAGARCESHHTDVTSQQSTDAAAQAALTRLGGLDILVNNAGVFGAPGWWDRDEYDNADWDAAFSVNVFGIVHATRSVEPHMTTRKQGKIINIASVAGRIGRGTAAHYSASKAAAINVTQATALRLARSNINVNAIAPGSLWTPLSEHNFERRRRTTPAMRAMSPREIFDRHLAETTPLGREQTPEDVGKLCAFLASERARSVTGQTINLTGGWQMN